MAELRDDMRSFPGKAVAAMPLMILLLLLAAIVAFYEDWFTPPRNACPPDAERCNAIDDSATYPRRAAGLNGIRIVPGQVVFSLVDRVTHNMTPIRWPDIMRYAPAQARINATIDNGQVVNFAVNDFGIPAPAALVRSAMQTWQYTPVMSGDIVVTYNLTTNTFVFDASVLALDARYNQCDVRYGLLYLIDSGGTTRPHARKVLGE